MENFSPQSNKNPRDLRAELEAKARELREQIDSDQRALREEGDIRDDSKFFTAPKQPKKPIITKKRTTIAAAVLATLGAYRNFHNIQDLVHKVRTITESSESTKKPESKDVIKLMGFELFKTVENGQEVLISKYDETDTHDEQSAVKIYHNGEQDIFVVDKKNRNWKFVRKTNNTKEENEELERQGFKITLPEKEAGGSATETKSGTPATREELQEIVENNLLNNPKERLLAITRAGGVEGKDGKGKMALIIGDFAETKNYQRITADGKIEIYQNGQLTDSKQGDKNTIFEHTDEKTGKSYYIKIRDGKFLVIPNLNGENKKGKEAEKTDRQVTIKPTFVEPVKIIENKQEEKKENETSTTEEERLRKLKNAGIVEHVENGKKYWTMQYNGSSTIKELRFENGMVSYYDKEGKKLGDPVKLSERELRELEANGVFFK